MSNLQQFLELFNPHPGNHYMQVTTVVDETTHLLYDLMQNKDGEFSLVLYGNTDANLQKLSNAKVKYVDDFTKPYKALPRSNDAIVLKDIFYQHKNKAMILKTAYTSLANTAEIIIMEKKGLLDINDTKEMLEKFEFRASNHIDLIDGYDLVIAKKMHMWGNGL